MIRHGVATLGLLCGLLPVALSSAQAADIPISGRKLVVKTEPASTKRKVLFKTVGDPGVVPGADPSVVGASLSIGGLACSGTCVPDGGSGEIVLDPTKWQALGNPPGSKGYKYRDRDATAGGVKVIVFKPGKLAIKAIGANWPWAPTGGHDSVVVSFSVGSDRLCADLALGDERDNSAGRLSFRNAPAPATCPTACGNGVVESGEECDGVGTCTFAGFGHECVLDSCTCCVSEGGVGCLTEAPCCDSPCVIEPGPSPVGQCSAGSAIGETCTLQESGHDCAPGLFCAWDSAPPILPAPGHCCTYDSCSGDEDCCFDAVCSGSECCVPTGGECGLMQDTCCSGTCVLDGLFGTCE